MHRSHRFLWIAVVGLLVYFGIRIHSLNSVPLFIDESINIERSVNIMNGTFIEHARTGKFLAPYLSIPFQPHINAIWSVRLGMLIITCLGIAAATALARGLSDEHGGLITLLLITFSPMLFLFDRFALSDTLLHVTITLWIFSLIWMFRQRRFTWYHAIISGIFFIVSMLAKSPTIFLVPLPIVFAVLIPRWRIITRVQAILIFYVTTLALWLPFMFVLSTRKIDYFGKGSHIAPSFSELFNIERISNNLNFMIGGIITYHNIVFILISVLIILIATRYRPRILLSLGAAILAYGIAIVLLGGYGLFIRYYTPIMPLLFICISIAAVTFIEVIQQKFNRNVIIFAYSMIIIWIGMVSLPFITQIYTDPHSAPLVGKDRSEYMRANSSGFAIPELHDYLIDLAAGEDIYVEGAIVSCYTLVLYTDDNNIHIQCPNVLSGDRRASYLNQYLPEEAPKHDRYYIVFETEGIISHDEITTLDLTLIQEFPRPGNGVIQLFLAE